MKWFALDGTVRKDMPKIITRSSMELNDYIMNVGDLLEDSDEGFYMETMGMRTLPYENLIHNSITFEMSLARMSYSRSVYGILDFLGDIGGLESALSPICAFIVGFL